MSAATGPRPDASDDERIVALLRSLGAREDEIDATPPHQRSALALDIVTRGGRRPVRLAEAAAATGRPAEDLARFWRALGLAVDPDAPIPASLVDATAALAVSTSGLIGEDTSVGLARVVGNASARLAEAVVDSFRVGFELPELERGVRYSDVVEQYVDITRAALPAFESIVLAAFRAHLVRAAGGAWAPDVQGAATRRDLAVGFADLVGYTALSRTLTPAALAELLRRFEDGVNDVVGAHGGRVVKQIGDGVMFTAETAAAGAAVALDLAAAFPGVDGVPPVRVGMAAGPVLAHYGDYYGDVVNLAARLVALARPGTVVVSEQVAATVGDGWLLERLPDRAVKGFGAPPTVFRLVGRS